MYFVWSSDSSLADTYMHVGQDPPGLDHKVWIAGESMVKAPKTLTMTGDEDSPTELSDVILTGFDLPVLSPRAIEVLTKAGVDNLQYFPIDITNRETGAVDKSYKIANIVGLIPCLDKNNATFTTFPDEPDELSYLDQYKIFEDKIVPQGKGKKPPLVFRLGEFRYHVLVHQSIKAAFAKAGLTGSKFVAPEDYA